MSKSKKMCRRSFLKSGCKLVATGAIIGTTAKNLLAENTIGNGGYMAYISQDACTSCGICTDVCPVDAIYEGDGKYIVDPSLCNDCGECREECPVEAIGRIPKPYPYN